MKPKFKVGDRVKIVSNNKGSGIVGNAMGKVGTVHHISSMIYIKFDKKAWQDLTIIGFFEDEIEKVSRIGQQLLFDFAKEE